MHPWQLTPYRFQDNSVQGNMPSKHPITAIFDIGKTNKKFLLFDEDFSIVHQSQINFEEIEDDDGYPSDDLDKITTWVKDEFYKVVSGKEFEVRSLNISTYGATLVHLGRTGKPVTPLYNYLKPCAEDLTEQFYSEYGGKEPFSLETASPPMGMLNSGLQLYWLKHRKPHFFNKIKTTFHLPQYVAYLFTGQAASEMTSIGCHTAMWDFNENSYHTWLETEDMIRLLPPIQPVWSLKKVRFNQHTFDAGIGIHDSSAALAPYLAVFDEPFIQLSTGTWSIAMNPYSSEPLTYDELRRDCLQYMNIFEKPVKASRFLLGGEYAHQVKKLGDHFGRNPGQIACEPDPHLIQTIANDADSSKKLVPEKASGSGPYPNHKPGEWNLKQFKTYEEAAHRLMLDLASIQADALKLAEGSKPVDQIIITGGFAKNQFFCRLLASMLPEKKIYTADVPEASALGASVVTTMNTLSTSQLKNQLKLNITKPFTELDFRNYSWAKI